MTVLRSAEAWGQFRLTAEAVSAESCASGDAAERGWLTCWGDLADEYCDSNWDLRELADALGRGYRPEGDGSDLPRWLTFEASSDDVLGPCDCWSFLSELPCGEEAIGGSISVHRPGWISDGSWARVCRLLGWRPYRPATSSSEGSISALLAELMGPGPAVRTDEVITVADVQADAVASQARQEKARQTIAAARAAITAELATTY